VFCAGSDRPQGRQVQHLYLDVGPRRRLGDVFDGALALLDIPAENDDPGSSGGEVSGSLLADSAVGTCARERENDSTWPMPWPCDAPVTTTSLPSRRVCRREPFSLGAMSDASERRHCKGQAGPVLLSEAGEGARKISIAERAKQHVIRRSTRTRNCSVRTERAFALP
jgi:hypothetical protein